MAVLDRPLPLASIQPLIQHHSWGVYQRTINPEVARQREVSQLLEYIHAKLFLELGGLLILDYRTGIKMLTHGGGGGGWARTEPRTESWTITGELILHHWQKLRSYRTQSKIFVQGDPTHR